MISLSATFWARPTKISGINSGPVLKASWRTEASLPDNRQNSLSTIVQVRQTSLVLLLKKLRLAPYKISCPLPLKPWRRYACTVIKLKPVWQKGLQKSENRYTEVAEILLQEVFLDPSCHSFTWAFMHNCSILNKSDTAFITSTQRTFHPAVLWGLGVFNKHVNYHSSLAWMQHLVFPYWRTLQFEVYRAIKDPHGTPDM